MNLIPSKTYHIVVSGKVQGVGFRNSVYRIATRQGVAGYVRNLRNGSVEIVAAADEELILEGFLEMVRMVRAPARVDRIESKIVTDFSFPDRSFRIEY